MSKPAVEMDGGAIEFKSFDDGVVTLMMQGLLQWLSFQYGYVEVRHRRSAQTHGSGSDRGGGAESEGVAVGSWQLAVDSWQRQLAIKRGQQFSATIAHQIFPGGVSLLFSIRPISSLVS